MELEKEYISSIGRYVGIYQLDEGQAQRFSSRINEVNPYHYRDSVLFNVVYDFIGVMLALQRATDEYIETAKSEMYQKVLALNPNLKVDVVPEQEAIRILDELKRLNEKKSTKKQKVAPKIESLQMGKVKGLRAHLKNEIIGQEKAINSICDTLEMSMLGIGEETRPRGSFIFAGLSGVGKTEIVNATSGYFWGDKWKESIVTINGSEYQSKHEISKLLGSAPGYIGYDNKVRFVEVVKKNPETIILFDEFEKAHPHVLDLFLQILDGGTLIDNKGNIVDFTKTIIIFTTNLGTKDLSKNTLGFGEDDRYSSYINDVMRAVKGFTRVEFLNRIDEIIVFNKLSKDDILIISQLQLLKLVERLKGKGYNLKTELEVVQHIADLSFTNEFGAREIKRIINGKLQKPIAKMILNSKRKNFKATINNGGIQIG